MRYSCCRPLLVGKEDGGASGQTSSGQSIVDSDNPVLVGQWKSSRMSDPRVSLVSFLLGLPSVAERT